MVNYLYFVFQLFSRLLLLFLVKTGVVLVLLCSYDDGFIVLFMKTESNGQILHIFHNDVFMYFTGEWDYALTI